MLIDPRAIVVATVKQRFLDGSETNPRAILLSPRPQAEDFRGGECCTCLEPVHRKETAADGVQTALNTV